MQKKNQRQELLDDNLAIDIDIPEETPHGDKHTYQPPEVADETPRDGGEARLYENSAIGTARKQEISALKLVPEDDEYESDH